MSVSTVVRAGVDVLWRGPVILHVGLTQQNNDRIEWRRFFKDFPNFSEISPVWPIKQHMRYWTRSIRSDTRDCSLFRKADRSV